MDSLSENVHVRKCRKKRARKEVHEKRARKEVQEKRDCISRCACRWNYPISEVV
jgi:hypothetical protein